jgi:flagellar protein FliS
MAPNPYAAYRQTQVATADPVELVVLLYEGAIRFTSNAIAALNSGDRETAHGAFLRAQEVVLELLSCLDLEQGAVAENLAAIYEYLYRRLVDANVRKDAAIAQEVVGHLRLLLDSWRNVRPTPAHAEGALAAPRGGPR